MFSLLRESGISTLSLTDKTQANREKKEHLREIFYFVLEEGKPLYLDGQYVLRMLEPDCFVCSLVRYPQKWWRDTLKHPHRDFLPAVTISLLSRKMAYVMVKTAGYTSSNRPSRFKGYIPESPFPGKLEKVVAWLKRLQALETGGLDDISGLNWLYYNNFHDYDEAIAELESKIYDIY